MNYEQKYKEALAWVESIYPELNHEHQMKAETFFPELAESEDERVREDILAFVKREGQHIDKYKWHKWIDWLEKLKVFAEHGDGLYYFGNNGFTYVCNPIWDNVSFLENQGEQKPFDYENATIVQKDFSPKEEPKFKVGDWVVWDNKISCHVDNIYQGKESLMYTITDTNNMTRSYSVKGFDNNARLWTIQDAKDGDVLFAENFDNIGGCVFLFKGLDSWKFDAEGDRAIATGYCCLSVSADNMEFGIQGPDCVEVNTIKPATKIQRDLLYRKMHEAGYIFDFEKKELKKLKFRVGDEVITENEESLTITRIDEEGYWSNELFICDFDSECVWDLVEQKSAEWSEEVKEVDLEKTLIGFQNRYAHENSGELPSAIEIAKHFFELGRSYWQKDNLWKPADGDDLPEIDREVIALLEDGEVVFAHRPPEYWNGKNIITNEVTRYYPKRYDGGGWNQPNVKWWLDLELPKTDE